MYFVSAVQAVASSLEIQTKLAEPAADIPGEEGLSHRIGIHLGDVFISQSDVMGNGVNIAARLQTEAEPGGICISQTVYDVVKSRLSLNATYVGPLSLKNIQEPVPAYQIPSLLKQESALPKQRFAKEEIAQETLVGGRYKIQRILGQGGFGRSYLVSDNQRFGELCVLKEFVPANKSSHVVQKGLTLFKREAKTLYQINHPSNPQISGLFRPSPAPFHRTGVCQWHHLFSTSARMQATGTVFFRSRSNPVAARYASGFGVPTWHQHCSSRYFSR